MWYSRLDWSLSSCGEGLSAMKDWNQSANSHLNTISSEETYSMKKAFLPTMVNHYMVFHNLGKTSTMDITHKNDRHHWLLVIWRGIHIPNCHRYKYFEISLNRVHLNYILLSSFVHFLTNPLHDSLDPVVLMAMDWVISLLVSKPRNTSPYWCHHHSTV